MSKRTGKPVGRPSKFHDPQIRQSIIDNTRLLGLRHLAANLAGVSETALYVWLAEADKPDAPAEYREFREEMEKARAEYIARKWGRIEMAAASDPKYWAADMTQLERMDPAHFGRRDRMQVEIPGEIKIVVRWPGSTAKDEDGGAAA